MGVSVLGAVIAISFALKLYADLSRAKALATQFAGIRKAMENKWYVDEIYEAVFIRPIRAFSEFLWKAVDVGVIDRVVLGFGKASEWTGQTVRVIQTGSIQLYAFVLLAGIVVSVGYLIYGMA